MILCKGILEVFDYLSLHSYLIDEIDKLIVKHSLRGFPVNTTYLDYLERKLYVALDKDTKFKTMVFMLAGDFKTLCCFNIYFADKCFKERNNIKIVVKKRVSRGKLFTVHVYKDKS